MGAKKLGQPVPLSNLVWARRQGAEAAAIDPVLLVPQEPTAERRLGAVAQQHLGFLPGEAGLQALALLGGGRGEVVGGGGGFAHGLNLQRMAVGLIPRGAYSGMNLK
jgi:hypothetical protein